MPQFNDPNALRAMLQMQGPGNMTTPRSNRELDLAGGYGQFEPSELELKMLQADATDQFTTPGRVVKTGSVPWSLGGGGSAVDGTSYLPGGSYTPSREELRDMLMGGVKKDLAMGEIGHQQKMQQELIPKQLEGEYGLREADITGQYDVAAKQAGELGALNRLLISQGGMNDRATANNEAAMGRTTANNEARRATSQMIQEAINKRQLGDDVGWGSLLNLFGLFGGGEEEAAPAPETMEMNDDPYAAEQVPTGPRIISRRPQ